MKEIMMTIHTTSDGESAVTVNAKFLDHASAVRFHEGLAALVKAHSPGGRQPMLVPKGGWLTLARS